MRALAQRVIDCCGTIATFTEEPGRITRTFLSPPMRDVHELLGTWMRALGMSVRVDGAGNLRGLLGSGRRRLIIGSHLDTVRNAGAFDGVLGVVLGVALVDLLQEFPYDLEVIGFSDEEGVRHGVPFIGSRAVAGTLEPGFGLDPDELPGALIDPSTSAYFEVHIEQGPVLESLHLPLGIVDGIAGQTRLMAVFEGKANHAGTTPWELRRDALAAAAEWIALVEKEGGTVGSLQVEPNVSNVIPGRVGASLDLRSSSDQQRHQAVDRLLDAARQICERRGLRFEHELKLDQPAVPLDPHLVNRLECAVKAQAYPVHRLTSGAGHDAMILAPIVPSAMLFLRSPRAISHHPDEAVLVEDVEAALRVSAHFLQCLTL